MLMNKLLRVKGGRGFMLFSCVPKDIKGYVSLGRACRASMLETEYLKDKKS